MVRNNYKIKWFTKEIENRVSPRSLIPQLKVIRKPVFMLLLLCTAELLNAQTNYKMTKNKWATELNFNLFQKDLKLNNAIDHIKIRYSISPDLTARLSLGLGRISTRDEQGADASLQTLSKKSTNIGFNLGLEKHFEGTGRLAPYIGGEFACDFRRSEYFLDYSNRSLRVSGAWYDTPVTFNGGIISADWTQRGYSSAGANLIAGFDFFLSRNLYCGYEMAYSVSFFKYSPIINEYEIKEGTGPIPTFPRLTGNCFEIGPKLLNGIRLGFVF
jgi:hypothetical protein